MVVVCLAVAALCVVSVLEKTHAHQSASARLAQPPDLVLGIGHSMKVNAVALGLDDRLLASASADNTIGLWDVASGRELRALSGHKGWVKCVAFSPDGRLLASGSNDKTIRIWDVATGKETHVLEGHTAPVESIAFSADGRWLASGSADNSVKLWDLTTGREANTVRGHSGWVTAVNFSRDGKWLVTGSKDTTVRLWDAATGREARILKGHTDRINAVAFSPNAEWIASASSDGTVRIWKSDTGKETRSLSSPAGPEIAVAFTGDGQSVLSVSSNRTVKVWNVATGSEVRTAGNPASLDFVESVAFASDAQSFVSSADKSAELYDSTSAKKIRSFDSRAAGFYTVAFSANARWFASAGKDKTIRLWDTTTGRQLPALVGHTGYVTSLVFSKDGAWMASGSIDRTIRVWDTSTGRETRKLTGHDEAVNALALSPDNQLLASASYDKSIRIWNPQSGAQIRALSGHAGEVTAIAFSADGKWLASGSVDKTIRVWSTETWAEPRVLTAASSVTAIAFSPDNKWLAASGSNFKLFDVTTWQETGAVQSTSTQVHALAFSPDSRWLATASADGAVRIWDPSSASPPRVLTGHSDSVNTVAFSADGKWLLSSGEDASILLWEAASGQKTATLAALRESDDWLVVTPDGLFDGSPAAWSQILWRFGGNTFNHLPVEVFFSEFYYPGLLAEILSGKRPQAPLDISQKDRRQPQVGLALPAAVNENEVTTRTVTVKINVAEARRGNDQKAGGVRDVRRLFRNASLVKAWRGDVHLNADGSAVLEAQVPIVAGRNLITAYAFNRDNIKSVDAEFSLTGSKELKRSGTAYIFVAGVNQYANSSFNLRYAVSDAGDFGAELQRAQLRIGNFTDIQVIPLLDRSVTKANFIYALQRLSQGDAAKAPAGSPDVLQMLKIAQPEDAVVIYFAGHGVATPDGRFYLIPHDLGYDGPRTQLDAANLRGILEHSISDRELEQALENIDAGQLVLVIDACNSGQALESEEKRRGPMNSKGLAQLAYEKGMYILTAAQSYQAALEQRRLGHGYLTYALVEEGLKTPAADARPKDGQVELGEWLDYAVARVPLMQAGTATDAQGRILEQEEDAKKKTRDVQRPRVFYRSNTDARQMIIARP
jgi:WD40 repeat protein